MHDDPLEFKKALVDLIDTTWRTTGHPDPADVERFRRGELAEEHAEPLRAHLLGCRECMTRWRSPEAFTATAVSEFERAAFWHSLQPRLQAAEPARSSPRWATLQRYSPWLAAACLVAVAGLSLWVERQQRELSRPRANVPVYDLDAAFEPRDGGATLTLEVPAGVDLTLILTPDTVIADAAELAIFDRAGRMVHTVRGLLPHPADGTFSLFLPAGALSAGDYRLELRRGAGTQVETYALRVAPGP